MFSAWPSGPNSCSATFLAEPAPAVFARLPSTAGLAVKDHGGILANGGVAIFQNDFKIFFLVGLHADRCQLDGTHLAQGNCLVYGVSRDGTGGVYHLADKVDGPAGNGNGIGLRISCHATSQRAGNSHCYNLLFHTNPF